MPLTISDEALRHLHAAPPDERQAFVESLSDEEAHTVADAYEGWQKRMGTVPYSIAAPGVPSAPEQMGPAPTSPADVSHLEVQPSLYDKYFAKPVDTLKEAGLTIQRKVAKATLDLPEDVTAAAQHGDPGGMEAMKAAIAAKGVDPNSMFAGANLAGQQFASKIGRPMAEGLIAQEKVLGGITSHPAGELLSRSALQIIGGRKVLEDMPDSDKLHAVNWLEDKIGSKGTTAALFAAEQIPYLPLLMGGGKAIGAAGNAGEAVVAGTLGRTTLLQAPTLSRLLALGRGIGGALGASAEAATFAGGQAFLQGEDVGKAALTGAVAGPALMGAGAALGKGLQLAINGAKKAAPRVIAMLTPKAVEGMGNEVASALKADTAPTWIRQISPSVIESKASMWEPSMAHLDLDADGKLVGHLYRIDARGAGAPKPIEAVTFPLETAAQQVKWRAMMEKYNIDFPTTGQSVLETVPADDIFYLMRRGNGPPDLDAAGEATDLHAVISDGKTMKLQSVGPSTPVDRPGASTQELSAAEQAATQETPRTVADAADQMAQAGKLSIRSLKEEGFSYQEAADQVAKMQAEGKIKRVQPGVWAFLKGEKGAARVGGPTQTTEFQAVQPKDLSPVKAEPPPPPGPGSLGPDDIRRAELAAKMFQKVAGREPSMWQKFLKPLISDHLRAPQDLGQMLDGLEAVKNIEAAKLELFHGMQRQFGDPELMSRFAKDLNKYAEGKLTEAEISKWPQWEQGKAAFQKVLAERDYWHKKFADRGIVPDRTFMPEDKGQEAFGQYVARQYLAHVLPPGEWAKMIQPDVIEAAAKEIGASGQAKNWTHAQVAAELLNIAKAEDPTAAFLNHPVFGKAGNRLKKREDLSPVMQRFLGKVESGPFNLAESVGSQRMIGALLDAWDGIAKSPYFSAGPTELHTFKLPDQPLYGDAKGGYVTQDIGDALVNLHQRVQSSSALLRSVIGWSKGNMVAGGGPGPYVNASMENLFSSMFAGGLDPFHPVRSGKAFAAGIKAVLSYDLDPIMSPAAELMKEARVRGVDQPGFHGSEVMGIRRKFMRELLDAVEKQPDATMLDHMKTIRDAVQGVVEKGYSKAGYTYDLVDRVFKMGNFIALKEKFAAKGMDPEAASKLAAYRIDQSFPNFQQLGSAINKWRHSGWGVAAKFFTIAAENARVYGMLPKRMLQEPDLAARMLATGIGVGALFGSEGIIRRANGISDAEVDAAKAEMSKRSQTYRPWLVAKWWRDDKGRPQFWDITPFNSMLRYTQGHPDDALWARVMANVLTSPFEQPDHPYSGMRGLLELGGLVRPMGQETNMVEGEAGMLKVMGWLWKNGYLAPSYSWKVSQALRKAGVSGQVGRNEEPWTMEQAAGKMAGLPEAGGITTAPGGPTERGGSMEALHELNDLQQQLRSVAMSPRPPEEKRQLNGAIIRRIKTIAGQMKQRQDTIQKFRQERGGAEQ